MVLDHLLNEVKKQAFQQSDHDKNAIEPSKRDYYDRVT